VLTKIAKMATKTANFAILSVSGRNEINQKEAK